MAKGKASKKIASENPDKVDRSKLRPHEQRAYDARMAASGAATGK